jgi:glycosyltransferase involved in cell wall biosynthesis
MFAADLIRSLGEEGVEQRVGLLEGTLPVAVGYDAETRILGGSAGRRRSIDVHAVAGLRSLVRRWRPHIVQAHGGEPFLHAVLAGASTRSRLIYRRIGLSTGLDGRPARRLGYGTLIRRSARIVAVAEAVRRETIDVFRVPAHDVLTIPRGVDRRRLRPTQGRDENRRRLGIPSGAPAVLSLGALSWEKDPLAHLEVLNLVRRTMPATVHLIAGEGPLRCEVEKTIRALGSDGRTRVLGNRPDVADLLSAVDVLLLASRVEGMPGCLIEAGMVGVPSVSYDVAGVSEVVVEGRTGFVVPQGDVAGLARRTSEVLRAPSVRNHLGAAARDRCVQMFDISSIAPRYLSVYEEVLA